MSPKDKSKPADGVFPTRWLHVVRVCVIVAAMVDLYLAWLAWHGGAAIGCGPESDCDRVLSSKWSRWLGIPTSWLALPIYGAMLFGSFRLDRKQPPLFQRQAWNWMLPGAVILLGAAVWFVALQLFVIHSICPYCMTAHTLGSFAAIILLWNSPMRPIPEIAWQKEKHVYIPPDRWKKAVWLALLPVAILAAGQIIYHPAPQVTSVANLQITNAVSRPQTNAPLLSALVKTSTPTVFQTKSNPPPVIISPFDSTSSAPPANTLPSTSVPPPVKTTSVSSSNNPLALSVLSTNRFDLYGGAFAFDLDEAPLLGNSNAPRRILSLFDYTCHHCRLMHEKLLSLTQLFSNQLAIVNLPMPLDTRCNYVMPATPRAHSNACEYAKLGLAIWRANRLLQPQFDAYIFTPERPPPVDQARQFAANLIGPDALNKALNDPWVFRQLQQGINIYATNYLHFRNGAMPQVVIGTNLISGPVARMEDLLPYLDKQLGLKRGMLP